MNSGSIAKRPDGRWRARYRDDAGKEHARHFKTRALGKAWLDQVTASFVRGDYVDPKAGKITVASYAATWEAAQVSSEGTKRIVDNALRLHLIPAIGTLPISVVKPTTIQAFVKSLETKGLSPKTIQGIYDQTSALFSTAVDDRLIAVSPCRKIRLPKSDGREVVVPTLDQVSALRSAFDARWQPAVIVLAGSGLRIGELLGLHVEHIDLEARTIRVEQQRLQSGHLAPVKSKTSRRVVPIGRVVVRALRDHLDGRTDGALFLDELGEPLIYRRWRTLAEAAAREAGVDVTAHTLRHFFASALISGGASVKQVQLALGHSSPMITLGTYSHLWPGDEDRTRDVVDAALKPFADSLRTLRSVDG